jgi:hypothetical protein
MYSAKAQTNTLVHHSKFGILTGKLNTGETRIGYSWNHFVGVKIDPIHEIGFTSGVDNYGDLNIVPMAFSWRGTLINQKKYAAFLGLDLGHGATWLEKNIKTDFQKQWYEGGFIGNANIGVRKKTKNNKVNYSWTVGLKSQKASFHEGFLSPILNPRPWEPSALPPGFTSLSSQRYQFYSLNVMWGIIF